MRKLICVTICLAVFGTGFTAFADEYPITYCVTAQSACARFNKGAEYDSFYCLKRGEEVKGKPASGGWCEVNCYGYKGFIRADSVRAKESMIYLGNFYITGYDGCRSCSPNGLTASGVRPAVGRTVAMAGVPFGTQVYIKGLGYYIAEDRGVGAGVIDVFVSNHREAYALTGYYGVYTVN